MYSNDELLQMISSDDPTLRYKACSELILSESSSPEIINALTKALHDKDEDVAGRARVALRADIHHQMAIQMGISEAENQLETGNLSNGTDEITRLDEVTPSFDPPASLFRRFAALFIDMLILAIVCIGIGLMFSSFLELMGFYTRLISVVIALLYFSLGNSIHFDGSTLGKRALHLFVKGLDGRYISFPRAILRSSILLILILFSGWQAADHIRRATS